VRKLVVAVVVLVGIAAVAKRFGPKVANVDWEKRFESMPDNAPPKWMFRNISEIHDNTDRILELLEPRSEVSPEMEAVAAQEMEYREDETNEG
jgi:hypothetical protein